MSSLNGYNENPYATPQKSGHAHGLVHATSTPIYPVQYPPPPLPISCLPQVPPANYQIPPVQAQSSDVGIILNEVLNRLNGLDQKLVRLHDIDKKLLKLDTMATNFDKLSDKVKCINNEVVSVKKKLNDVEKSSDFISGKIDDITRDNAKMKSDVKSFSMTINNQNKLLQERIGVVEIQNAKLKTEISKLSNTTKSETGYKNFHGLSLIKKENDRLKSTVLDLQCQSLSENLVFMGIPEQKDENAESSIILDILRIYVRTTVYVYM